mmetsp:Transcript_11850/g.10731  ORF Transcript_11850/g.10731 Transcript_11850/m.10731 type:complete len:108 (+) Transcript_11850:46-369(+)
MFFSKIVRSNIIKSKFVRNFSGHSADDARKEVVRWFQISIGMVSFSALALAYILATDVHVHQDKPDLYVTNNKPYPWECPECNLFDSKCWSNCKAKAKGLPTSDSHH